MNLTAAVLGLLGLCLVACWALRPRCLKGPDGRCPHNDRPRSDGRCGNCPERGRARPRGAPAGAWCKEGYGRHARSDGARVYFVDGIDRWFITGPDGEEAHVETTLAGVTVPAMFETAEEAMRDVDERWPLGAAA